MHLIAVFLAALCAAVFIGPLGAAAQTAPNAISCSSPGVPTDVRPKDGEGPTEVMLGMRVVDIVGISDVDQTITIDVAIRMQWSDPRLADFAGCKLPINQVWFPSIFLVNSGRIFDRWPQEVSVAPGGKITYLQRSSGTFSSYHNLQGFPFDNQVISLDFVALEWSLEKLVYKVDEAFVGIDDKLNISDWKISGIEVNATELEVPAFGQVRSALSLNVFASRYISFYFWKVLLPIGLIVVMSWSVFYVHPSQFGTQLGLSATSVLTMVAYIFATTNLLPRLGYFTLLDSYIAMATIFVFLGLLQSLITGFLASRKRETLAMRIDLASRVLFPAAFGLGCVYYFSNIF